MTSLSDSAVMSNIKGRVCIVSPATLQDVARMAGVSTKTVSRVINDEANVAADTGERVSRAIADLNYVPNSAARSLSRGRAMAIAMVAGWSVNTAYSSMLIDHMLKDTTRVGHSFMLFPSDDGTAERVAGAFLGQQIDSIILDTMAAENPSLIDKLRALKRPYVVLHPNYLDRYEGSSFVRIDNFRAAKQATDYLIGLGHRAIGFVSFPVNMPGNERLSGYRAALEGAGIGYRPDYVHEALDRPVQIGYQGALRLISGHSEITALFAATDEIAIGTLTAIWQQGLKVPEDISVIGFDDISLSSLITPPLTTIRQPMDQISRAVVETAISLAENPLQERVDLVLPTELVVRNSCQKPRSTQA
jgi:DNA-binding LacI/PurR family transcriptional regulator